MTHTPGPWAVDDDTLLIFSTAEEHEAGWLAVVRGGDSTGNPVPASEVLANARLIAAAPALLESLKYRVARIRTYEEWASRESVADRKFYDPMYRSVLQEVRQFGVLKTAEAIIANVEGRNP